MNESVVYFINLVTFYLIDFKILNDEPLKLVFKLFLGNFFLSRHYQNVNFLFEYWLTSCQMLGAGVFYWGNEPSNIRDRRY